MKQTCGPGRIYCLACRAPKAPAGMIADCLLTGNNMGVLQGICPDCNRMIYRRINPQKLSAVRGDLEITITQAQSRIGDRMKPNVNCDLTGVSKNEEPQLHK